ncbi:MAG: S24 family peptidase [Pyrinomonadaceae bacterium]
MQPRTKRQKDVLDFITRYVLRNGHEPSYQHIARQLGISAKSGVARHIEALETQGLISRRRENGSFCLSLNANNAIADSVYRIDLFEISPPEDAAKGQTISDIAVPKILLGSLAPDEVFAVRAVDDSMIDKNICSEDIILMERRNYARRGEIVAAMADDKKMILAQFFQIGVETELRLANQDCESIVLPADKVIVKGIMRGMLRPIAALEH